MAFHSKKNARPGFFQIKGRIENGVIYNQWSNTTSLFRIAAMPLP